MIDWNDTIEWCLRDDVTKDSHTELDPYTFHPSQIAQCKRQCYISKLGIGRMSVTNLGELKVGTIVHEWLEEKIPQRFENVDMEVPVHYTRDGVTFVGHSDCVEYTEHGVFVHDFKTRGSWYKFDGVEDYHRDQVMVYMDALSALGGKIVYLSKKSLVNYDNDDKSDWWVEAHPEKGCIVVEEDNMDRLVLKGKKIGEKIEEEGLPEGPEDIPFDPCGCWICGIEKLDEEAFY